MSWAMTGLMWRLHLHGLALLSDSLLIESCAWTEPHVVPSAGFPANLNAWLMKGLQL